MARRLSLVLVALGLLASAGQALAAPPPSEAGEAVGDESASPSAPEPASQAGADAAEVLAAVAPSLFVVDAGDAETAAMLVPAEFSLAGPAPDDHDDTALVADPVVSAATTPEPGSAGGAGLVAPPWLLVFRAAMVRAPAIRAPRTDRSPLLDSVLVGEDLSALSDAFGFRGQATMTDTETADLRLLLARGEQWHVLRAAAVATSRPVDLRVTASGQLAYVPSVAPVVRAAEAPHEPGDAAEPRALGLTAEVDRLELGAEYRSVGRRLERIAPTPEARKDRVSPAGSSQAAYGFVRVTFPAF